jgi:ankyrin repeat protein
MAPRTAAEAVAAAESGDIEALAAFCAQPGVDVNAPIDPATGETLLHVAAAAGQVASIKALIRAGGTLDVLDNDEQNALHYASNEGHVAVARLFVQNGIGSAEINRLDKYRMSPLHLAVEGGHLEMVRFLTHLPQADEKIRRGSVTFIAERHDYAAIVELLSRPRETVYDERGNRILEHGGESVNSFSSQSGGRTAAARRRSRVGTSEDGSDVGSLRATGSLAISRATSRPTTPRPPVEATIDEDEKVSFCGRCVIA